MLSRRTVLVGGATMVTVGGAGALGVERGDLPGRPWLQEHLGLNGDDGTVPDVESGPIITGHFTSEHRHGADVGWALVLPPNSPAVLPLVVALHAHGGTHRSLLEPGFGLPQYLASAVAHGVPPFAIATVDGGNSYWHQRPGGEDAGAMVTEELLPMLSHRPELDTTSIGLIGWSMGGYGALRIAGLLGAEQVAAVAACSPALWSDGDDASRDGFADAEEYAEFSVVGRQADLDGISVRIDIGTGDPFYRDVQAYADGFDSGSDLTSTFEPGAHDAGYFRRQEPPELAFLGDHLRS